MQPRSPDDPPVSRAIVLDAVLPAEVEISRVQVRRIRMHAGVAAGRHVHNGPVLGSVVSGSVLFQVAGHAPTVLEPGDVFYEPAETAIDNFDARDEDVEFLAFFPLRDGQEPDITFED
jgi:quercetin dioxygenase-like cupin family protein